EKEDKGEKFHRIERSYGSFYRSFSLPRTVDAQAIKASFDNGMLQLILPKTASASPDSVEIKVE
ncbi:MAG: Hsp20/alpha crystallin family protein, partial [Halothiobacillaceae bacterium]|nr:Hsp20/alpha crystallin family protein [Halothiobacillaceae bacterium]